MRRTLFVTVFVCLLAPESLPAGPVAAPVITLVEPELLLVGDDDATLVVTGSGLVAPVLGPTPAPGTVIVVDPPGDLPPALILPTTFVSPNELEAVLPGTGTRASVVRTAILMQLSEQAITSFLNSTGGFYCSFADVCPPGSSPVTDSTGIALDWRYIETAFRLGYPARNCPLPDDGQRRFCPNAPANLRGEELVLGVAALGPPEPQSPPPMSNVVDVVVIAQPVAAPGLGGAGLAILVIALAAAGWAALRAR